MPTSLPFETDYLSRMSDDEMLQLADELEHTDFWRTEDHIQEAVDKYMQMFWRRPPSFGRFPTPMMVDYGNNDYLRSGKQAPPVTHVKTVVIRVPDALGERTARLFAEAQVREQMSPGYDPTED